MEVEKLDIPESSNAHSFHNSENSENRDNDNKFNTDSDVVLKTEIWVFGYGSLCWYPGFEYNLCVTGYIRGYVRRFWQGNSTHRGTKDKPGRVATLIRDRDGITWGCAYKIKGQAALSYLKHRECKMGGYITQYTKFYPRVATDHVELTGESFLTVVYIATQENHLWMGESSLKTIANVIAESEGPAGHNVEYLIRLANFMREELREANVEDDHLFQLERLVLDILHERKISVESLMGTQQKVIRFDSIAIVPRPVNFQFTSRVPDKKLRCLNI